jgi:heat shock protein HtpX
MKVQLFRSLFLLATLVVLVVAFGQKFGHRDAFVVSVTLALGIIGVFLWYGDIRLVPLLQVEEIEGHDPWGIRKRLSVLSERARVSLPRIFIIPSDTPQALAVGQSQNSGKIFLTQGLLKLLTPDELNAVLAYNLMCIKNRSTVSFTIGSAMADAILSVGGSVDWLINWLLGSGHHAKKRRVQLVTWLVAPAAALMVRLSVGKLPYLQADHGTAQLLGEGRTLATVLWKLHSYALTQPFAVSPATAHFFMVNPLTTNHWGRYFHAHPQIRERIQNLIGHYPI